MKKNNMGQEKLPEKEKMSEQGKLSEQEKLPKQEELPELEKLPEIDNLQELEKEIIHERKKLRYDYKELVFLGAMLLVVIVAIVMTTLVMVKDHTIDDYKKKNEILQTEHSKMALEIEELNRKLKENEKEVFAQISQTDRTNQPGIDGNLEITQIDRKSVEESTYTYFQGPYAWKKKLPWSGRWGKEMYDGGSFGGFGCGLVCMANIYSTLSEHEASPIDLYEYAKENTEYYGGGAIDWNYMEQVLTKLGMECELCRKPESYKEFRESIEKGKCAIALVWSYECSTYWQDNDGHYVTIFGYDKESEEVFLADSGDPNHNRHWVSLDKIYSSLKSRSDWQYMNILSFDEDKCEWKNETAGGKWVRPENWGN